jgi:hypothetical protein
MDTRQHPPEEIIESMKASFSRMLLALYAAQRLARDPERQEEVAEAIAHAETLERETMKMLGEPSQIEYLRELIRHTGDLEELAQFLAQDAGLPPSKLS